MQATINGRTVEFESGETILQVASRNGFFIPTLCHFAPIKNKPGTCRVCLVEATNSNGETNIVASCTTPCEPGMQIDTVSERVRKMQRLQVEMVFADHEQDCIACARHGNCELQDLGEYVGLTTNRFAPRFKHTRPTETSALGVVRDPNKCVRCMRCVQVCRTVQGVDALSFDSIGTSSYVGADKTAHSCIQCGQCILVCPTGAISEHDDSSRVMDWLYDTKYRTVFSFAPAVRVALGEEFGMKPGTNVEGRIVAALRRMGADFVLDTDFTADVVIMEEGTELLENVKKGTNLPMFTSCCPGWINFAEKHIPAIIPHLSTTRSPQAVYGSLARTYLTEKSGIDPATLKVISIMPCTAKKDEIGRPQLAKDGKPDVDAVITVREFASMLRRFGIDLNKVEPEAFDNPLMSDSTGAAVIFGTTGGVMEAALRTVYAVLNGKELPQIEFHSVRGNETLREADIDLGAAGTIKVAICHGLITAKQVAEDVLAGKSPYTFIEVMACPGGCINGGGTARVKRAFHPDTDCRQNGLYAIDRTMPRRQSHNNPQIKKLYDDYLEKPGSHLAHELLHTHYTDRRVLLDDSISSTLRKVTLMDDE